MTETLTHDVAPMTVEPEDGKRRKALVAGGLVAALALSAGGYLLLSGGSSDDTGFVVPSTRKGSTVAGKPAVKKAAKPAVQTVPAVSRVRLGRDPFKPLYVEPAVAPATTTSTTTSTTTPTSTTTGVTTGATYALKLVKIATSGETKLYTFNVAGTAKTVIAAQRFGQYGELVVLAWVKNSKGAAVGAVLQVGDDEPLTVKVGETISVQ